MYLKNDKLVITIKNVEFRSSRVGTAAQFVLDPNAITGWTDGVNVRRDATVRPVSSGDFTEPYTLSSRLISITGAAIAPSIAELQALRDKLMGLISPGEYTTISVATGADTRYATVGLEGSISWVKQLDKVAYFKMDLYAPDPHIYGGEKRQKAGAYIISGGLEYPLAYPLDYHLSEDFVYSTIKNNGNAISYPVFEVVGDYYSGFSIADNLGGNTITYTGMVTQYSPVTIDTARGTATQGGVDRTVLLTERNWFGIPPQTTINPIFAPLDNNGSVDSGWCDIIYRDTWI